MKVFASVNDGSGQLRACAVCLGNFDGVHLGHQALIAQARAAKSGAVVAFTFDPHPGKVLQPALAPRLICEQGRKLELLEAAGVDATVLQPFSLDYAKTTPPQFEASLFTLLGAKAVVVGADFTYGQKRAGTVETLRAAASRAGAALHVVPQVTVDGVVVSSTKIREYVLEGRVEAAARLLGRPFDLDGLVVKGAGRGRTIGFPTANVETANELRPAPGVYAVKLQHGSNWFGGAANIGVKPTFGGAEVTIEVHLFDFSGDLYGQRLRVQFVERLRSEKRFASVTELAGQITRDIESARTALQRAG